MATIGGMNSNSILPYIDYDEFKRNPKIIIGSQLLLYFLYTVLMCIMEV